MYKLAIILTQSKIEPILYPGRIIEIYYNHFLGEFSGGIIYTSCGCEVYNPMIPDFKFKILE